VQTDGAMTTDVCARCGHSRKEHSYNGACYGLCGKFVPPSDIVERLRDWRDFEPMKQFCAEAIPDLLEAADEIEQLRAALENESSKHDGVSKQYASELGCQIDELEVEIKWLRELLNKKPPGEPGGLRDGDVKQDTVTAREPPR
jgi:hypothetical protein